MVVIYAFYDRQQSISGSLKEELKVGAFCLGPVILIPPNGFLVIFLAFLGGSRVNWHVSLTGPSP
jgi:hypothetical protein